MKKAIVFVLLLVMVLITACSSTPNADGAQEMSSTLADLKKQISANDLTAVKKTVDTLHDQWETFEDGVKEKSAALYEKVETPLGIIVAGGAQQTLDQETLNKAIAELEGALKSVRRLD